MYNNLYVLLYLFTNLIIGELILNLDMRKYMSKISSLLNGKCVGKVTQGQVYTKNIYFSYSRVNARAHCQANC